MPVQEYKVIPAPLRPQKAKGVKSTAEKFALALTTLMNEMGRDGWEYVRAETLPCEEPKGLMGRKDTSFQTLLVFRRPAQTDSETRSRGVTEPVLRPAGLTGAITGAMTGAAPAAPLSAVVAEGSSPRVLAPLPRELAAQAPDERREPD